MVPEDVLERSVDPVEALNGTLERAWGEISRSYDVSSCLPELRILFEGADLSRPSQAAEAALVVMLQEVIECVGRFSPWYKQPARAFGLTSVRDNRSNRIQWLLAPEATLQWQDILKPLAAAIRKYSGLIHAMILVDDLMSDLPGDPCITAHCSCKPPHSIQLRRSVMDKAEILCYRCKQPYLA